MFIAQPGMGHKHHVPSFTLGQLPGILTATFLAWESKASLLQPLSQETDTDKLMILIRDLHKNYENILVHWSRQRQPDALNMDSKLGKPGKGGQEGKRLSFSS